MKELKAVPEGWAFRCDTLLGQVVPSAMVGIGEITMPEVPRDATCQKHAARSTIVPINFLLWGTIISYAAGRLCQLYAGRMPILLIVFFHVVPPALFALVHGSIVYGRRGIAIFAACCIGIGSLAEMVALRTGVPFGHYHFTDVMGPKVLDVPLLLALAYFGIGYVSWILSLVILGYVGRPMRGSRVLKAPVLASVIMTAWDLAMDPNWSTMDRAWIWHDGGAFFGVPLTNFLGWFFTGTFYYLVFALYCRSRPARALPARRSFWSLAVLVYLICALGNLLILKLPMAPPVVTDAAGHHWLTSNILASLTLVSLLLMTPLAGLAFVRVRALSDRVRQESGYSGGAAPG